VNGSESIPPAARQIPYYEETSQMNMIRSLVTLLVFAISTLVLYGGEPADEKDITDRVVEMGEVHERVERERSPESMRDKTHDNRVSVSERTSVGAGTRGGVPEVNVRVSTDKPRKDKKKEPFSTSRLSL
jgi:hypothetical protein